MRIHVDATVIFLFPGPSNVFFPVDPVLWYPIFFSTRGMPGLCPPPPYA